MKYMQTEIIHNTIQACDDFYRRIESEVIKHDPVVKSTCDHKEDIVFCLCHTLNKSRCVL